MLSKVEAQKALQRALQQVEGQRAAGMQDDDQVETIKDEVPKEDGHTRPGWSRRHHYSGSITPVHSGPSTPTGPTVLPRRQTSSRNGSRQTSPLATPMSFEAASPPATASTSNALPRRVSSTHVSPSHGQTMSGIDRRGNKKSDMLGLRGISRPVRDSQSSVSTLESNGPPTPMDEITLSLQRYAAEQEAAEKRKRHTRGRTTSQDLDVSFDADDAHTTKVDGLPRRRSYDRTPSRDRTPDATGLPSGVQKDKESVIPFPKSASVTEQELPVTIPTPASPLKSNVAIHRVINPRHTTRSGPSLGLRRQPSSSLQLDIPATPPIDYHDMESGNSTPYASTWEGNRPTSSMIRKKSGELVKPSLKVRSQSTPHLPLRGDMMGSKSEPATPALGEDDRDFGSDRHKNVRFAGSAGDQGARLESVVLFLREQKVTAVSKTADGEEGMYPPTETETEADTDAREYAAFRRKRNAALQNQDEAEKFAFGEGSSVVPKARLDFSPMNKDGLKDHNVMLERVEMSSGSEPVALRGTILVRNVAFQKWVAVRFTMDDWQ